MNIQPLGERVLLKSMPAEDKTSTGIIIPAATQEKTNQAEVVAVGDCSEITVKVGQKVMYDKYAGTSFKMEGQDYLLISHKDILAIIN